MTKTKQPSLRKNVAYSGLANALFSLTQWCIMMVVVRWGAPEQVGAVTVATALVTPIFMFAQMAMRDGIAVDDLDFFKRADYVVLRMISSFAAVFLVSLLTAFYLDASGSMVQIATAAFALVKLMGAQTNMNHGLFQRAERLDYVAISMLSRGLLGLAAFAVVFISTKNLAWSFCAEAVAWWLGIVLIDRRLLIRLEQKVSLTEIFAADLAKVLRLARWMLPLGLAVLLMNAAASVPRLVLERSQGLAVVGVFGAIAYLNVALNVFSSSIGTASAARMRRQFRGGQRRAFLSLTFKLLGMSGAIGLCLMVFSFLLGGLFLELVYGPRYARVDILNITVAAAALRIVAAPLQFAMNAGQEFSKRMRNSLVTFGVAIVSACVLIPELGAVGAAWALFVQAFVNIGVTLMSFAGMVKAMPATDVVKRTLS